MEPAWVPAVPAEVCDLYPRAAFTELFCDASAPLNPDGYVTEAVPDVPKMSSVQSSMSPLTVVALEELFSSPTIEGALFAPLVAAEPAGVDGSQNEPPPAAPENAAHTAAIPFDVPEGDRLNDEPSVPSAVRYSIVSASTSSERGTELNPVHVVVIAAPATTQMTMTSPDVRPVGAEMLSEPLAFDAVVREPRRATTTG